ncbi:hypothetical protein TNCV_938011 [Trichonephila clavipes]|nr:hypothetical protein TNCV_938011 [Trichonephila clavipes]
MACLKGSEKVLLNVTLMNLWGRKSAIQTKTGPLISNVSCNLRISLIFQTSSIALDKSSVLTNTRYFTELDKADGPISYRSVSEGVVARLDFPGAVQKVYIRSEGRKDSPRGTTGSRPPSGVPRATLFSN